MQFPPVSTPIFSYFVCGITTTGLTNVDRIMTFTFVHAPFKKTTETRRILGYAGSQWPFNIRLIGSDCEKTDLNPDG